MRVHPELADETDETDVSCEIELAVDGAVLADVLAWFQLVRPAIVDVLQDPNRGAAVHYRFKVSGGAVVVEAVGVGGYWHGAVRVAAA